MSETIRAPAWGWREAGRRVGGEINSHCWAAVTAEINAAIPVALIQWVNGEHIEESFTIHII